MTHLTLQGLSFKVHSPSLLELVATDDGSLISIVTVCYIPRAWWIDVLMKQGHSINRGPFRSRDDAVALLAGRRQERSA